SRRDAPRSVHGQARVCVASRGNGGVNEVDDRIGAARGGNSPSGPEDVGNGTSTTAWRGYRPIRIGRARFDVDDASQRIFGRLPDGSRVANDRGIKGQEP